MLGSLTASDGPSASAPWPPWSHDAVLILGIFAWFGKEFDAVFLAALLTIIAFSVNDTVVVFDRIREQRDAVGSESFVARGQ